MGKTLVVVDTDPGADDAVALLFLAARPDVELLAVGSVFGNVSAPTAAENALRLLEVAGLSDVPVAVGADEPLEGNRLGTAEFVHGDDGLGNAAGPPAATRPVSITAAEQLVEIARANPGEVSLLALGPLTNVALALRLEPELPRLLRQVVWMGGRVHVPGNLARWADANTLHDPHAAEEVLAAGMRLTVVPLDATQHSWVGQPWLDRVAGAETDVVRYALAVSGFYTDFYTQYVEGPKRGGARGCVLHDPMAAVLLLEPDLASYESHRMAVELTGTHTFGMTVADLRGYTTEADLGLPEERPAVRIALAVDHETIMDRVAEALTSA